MESSSRHEFVALGGTRDKDQGIGSREENLRHLSELEIHNE